MSRSGGIALFWKEGTTVALRSFCDHHIDVYVGESTNLKRWPFTGIYGYPKIVDRHLTWSLLKCLSNNESVPWLVGGNFNEILACNEKAGSVTRNERKMNGFRETMAFCALKDLHFVGPKFTWGGIRCGHEVKVRLDRFLASVSWSDWFPASQVIHRNPCNSDHLPLLIEVRAHRLKKKRKKEEISF